MRGLSRKKIVFPQSEFHFSCLKVAPKLKERMMKAGTLMVSFQPHKSLPNFWRAIISNLAVRKEDIDYCISEINRLGEDL